MHQSIGPVTIPAWINVNAVRRRQIVPSTDIKVWKSRLRCSDLSPGPEPIRAVPELRVPLEEV